MPNKPLGKAVLNNCAEWVVLATLPILFIGSAVSYVAAGFANHHQQLSTIVINPPSFSSYHNQ